MSLEGRIGFRFYGSASWVSTAYKVIQEVHAWWWSCPSILYRGRSQGSDGARESRNGRDSKTGIVHQPGPGLGMASCIYKVGGLELMIRLNNSHLLRMECFMWLLKLQGSSHGPRAISGNLQVKIVIPGSGILGIGVQAHMDNVWVPARQSQSCS